MISIPPRPLDTSREADELQFKSVREMSFEKRWRILFDFIESGRRLLEEGIRNRHPEYTDEEVRLASIRARIGDELFVNEGHSASPTCTALTHCVANNSWSGTSEIKKRKTENLELFADK